MFKYKLLNCCVDFSTFNEIKLLTSINDSSLKYGVRLSRLFWWKARISSLVISKREPPIPMRSFGKIFIEVLVYVNLINVFYSLGNEKYKSRIIWRSLNPKWLEQFDLHLYDDGDQQLEITVWDKDRSRDDFIGRCLIDLSQLERETTHSLWQELEDGAGTLHLLLTISGTTASETISDLSTHEANPREREILEQRYVSERRDCFGIIIIIRLIL